MTASGVTACAWRAKIRGWRKTTISNTKINWATKTWNPIEGCLPCSPGCRNCYARDFANRMQYNSTFTYVQEGQGVGEWACARNCYADIANWDGTLAEFPDRWREPLSWRKPQRIFVGSRSDLALWSKAQMQFVFGTCDRCTKHRFLCLTKRPEMLAHNWTTYPPDNLWLGVTACNQAEADEKIPALLRIPAAGYWLSVEPMLGPVEFTRSRLEWLSPFQETDAMLNRTPRIDWIVCGGESGKGARRILSQWAVSLLDQCEAAGVPFWFKQWSRGQEDTDDAYHYQKHGEALIGGREYHQLPAALRLPGEVEA